MLHKLKHIFCKQSDVELLYPFKLAYKIRLVRDGTGSASCISSDTLEATVKASNAKEAARKLRDAVRKQYEQQILVWNTNKQDEVL